MSFNIGEDGLNAFLKNMDKISTNFANFKRKMIMKIKYEEKRKYKEAAVST